MELLAKTLSGLESILADEIQLIGGKNTRILKRAVHFEGNREVLYRVNYHLRTALRILLPISRFDARGDRELYGQVRQVPWEQYLDAGSTLHVDSVVYSDVFTHSQYISQRVKDAIVDRFMEKQHRRPAVSHDAPDLRINMHIHQQQCTLSLDSSGESLHKRGYRVSESAAPLNEVLAAGMILLSGWRGDRAFMDPMCGSGTLLIEAAMIAMDIPPGFKGRTYGFQRWKDYDPELFKHAREYRSNKPAKSPEVIGSDISPKAVLACRSNLAAAGLQDIIRVDRKDFFRVQPDSEEGIVIMNPPYGERIGKANIDDFYRGIGDRLKKAFTGHQAWILSSNREAMKYLGLRPHKRLVLFNGPLECQYSGFRLYRGSMKSKYRNEAT